MVKPRDLRSKLEPARSGSKVKLPGRRLHWATTEKVNRASRTEDKVESFKAKRWILEKARKGNYKATGWAYMIRVFVGA